MSHDADAARRATEAPRSEPPPTPSLPRKGGGGAAADHEAKPWATKDQSVATHALKRFAKANRAGPTDAERKLWLELRRLELGGTHFRRQVVIPPYIADFACRSLKLIVEVDGGQHAESTADDARTAALEAAGWRVLRFWNNDVLLNIEGVMEAIRAAVEGARAASSGTTPTPNPSPLRGGGQNGAHV